jgi:hypothetical protein
MINIVLKIHLQQHGAWCMVHGLTGLLYNKSTIVHLTVPLGLTEETELGQPHYTTVSSCPSPSRDRYECG